MLGPWPIHTPPFPKDSTTWTPVWSQWLSHLVEELNGAIGAIGTPAAAGTLTGTTLAATVLTSSLTSVGTLGNLTVTNPITGSVTGSSGSTSGNAATATALQTARAINGVPFDGTAPITVTAAASTLTGTLGDGTLSSNVALKNGTNAFTGANSFATTVLDLLVGQLKFPATQNASSTATTLDDYEEGTWTPTDGSGAGIALTTGVCQYLKIGQLVFVSADVTYPGAGGAGNAALAGLPFTSGAGRGGLAVGFCNQANVNRLLIPASSATIGIYIGAGQATNAQMLGFTLIAGGVYRAAA